MSVWVSKILLFPLFIDRLYPYILDKRLLRLILLVGLACTAIIMFTPAFTYFRLLGIANILVSLVMIGLWIVLAIAAKRRMQGANLSFISFTIYIALVFNDILFAFGFVQTGNYMYWGFYLFVFSQALLLGMSFSKSFSKVEILSKELQSSTERLEERVRIRTQSLEKSNSALTKVNDELQKKNDQILDYEKSRQHLLSNISHELRTPITLIQGYLEALIHRVIENEEKRQKHLVQIHGKVLHINKLIQDLFELSRLEVRQASFKIGSMPLRQWLDSMMRYSSDVEQGGFAFRYEEKLDHEAEQKVIFIDPDRMHQVLLNLIMNAMKFSDPSNGMIQIIVQCDKELRVTIVDNGMGIPEDHLPYIFERFYKSKQKHANQGTGLGLAISKEIVEYHGGQIGAKSHAGQGTQMYFTLPLYESEAS